MNEQVHKIHIIGKGISGLGLEKYLLSKNYLVETHVLHTEEDAKQIDWNGQAIYYSPGVRVRFDSCKHLIEINDFDILYLDNPNAKFIVITGTAGKTTTSSLLSHILNYNNIDNYLCGNMGIDIFGQKSNNYILEMSSFQTEYIKALVPTVAIITNLYPDHLDIHETYENYKNSKFNILNSKSKYWYLGSGCEEIEYQNNALPIVELNNTFNVSSTVFENFIICASVALSVYDISIEKSIEAFKTYIFPRYRETLIYKSDFLTIVNNSKCTNIISLQTAINNYTNITLICCGFLKISLNHNVILKNLNNIKEVWITGPHSQRFYDYFTNICNKVCIIFDNLEAIVNNISIGCIVFSPLGTSFDLFKSYYERGKYFDSLIFNKFPEYTEYQNTQYNDNIK